MPLSSDRHIIDEKFSSTLDNYSVKPSGRLWMRIAHSLNLQQKSSSAKRIFIIAGLLLLIGSSAGLFEAYHHSKLSFRKHKRTEQINLASLQDQKQLQDDINDVTPRQAVLKESEIELIRAVKNYSSYPQPLTERSISGITKYPAQGSRGELISSLPTRSVNLNNDLTLAKEIHRPRATRTDKIMGFSIKTYYLGLTASFNNTWLIDKVALASNNLEYQPTFGGSYGMQGGYVFSKHWGIQAAWIVNSFEGQKYKNLDLYGRTTSLGYTQESIMLTYMQFPVLVQYKLPMFSEMLNTPIIFNITLGGQYGALISYRIDNVKNEELNNHLFKKNEVAAVGGFDYDFMVNRPVFYSLGLRASYGTNIFKPGEVNYFQFNAPHNFVIGVHAAVNFSFSK